MDQTEFALTRFKIYGLLYGTGGGGDGGGATDSKQQNQNPSQTKKNEEEEPEKIMAINQTKESVGGIEKVEAVKVARQKDKEMTEKKKTNSLRPSSRSFLPSLGKRSSWFGQPSLKNLAASSEIVEEKEKEKEKKKKKEKEKEGLHIEFQSGAKAIKVWYEDHLYKVLKVDESTTAKMICDAGAVKLGLGSKYTYSLYLILDDTMQRLDS